MVVVYRTVACGWVIFSYSCGASNVAIYYNTWGFVTVSIYHQ